MAFLRFTRDPRGYEHFYLVEQVTNRRGKSRAQVLYWFRTPPNVKVGRDPFDPSIREALEKQNPGVDFDWRKILDTPIPSADAEKWRERRRAEKAEKIARRAAAAAAAGEEAEEPVDAVEPDAVAAPVGDSIGDASAIAEGDTDAIMEDDRGVGASEAAAVIDEPAEVTDDDKPPHVIEAAAASAASTAPPDQPRRRRRRRRRGRAGRPPENTPPAGQ